MTKKRKIIIAILAVLMATISVVTLQMSGDSGKVRVEIVVIPEDSTITLNGEKISSGNILLEPGEYTLVASRQYFTDDTVTIHTDQINPEEPIYLLPTPDSPEARELLADNPEMQARREAAGGAIFGQQQQKISEDYPITTELPIIDRTFRIDYGASEQHPDDPTMIAIYIHAVDQQGRDDALNWMRTFGYNPDSYEILYVNPLNEE